MTSNPNGRKKEIDSHSGVETTGHEWDGIKELNNPAPRWWLWIFYITCIWSLGYWVVYPSWPTLSGEGERGGTKGSMEWTQYDQLKKQQADIVARKARYLENFRGKSFQQIMRDPELYAFAIAGGKSAFKDNCATCHGTGGTGAPGYPNLNDDDWLWGGAPEDIYETLKYGIRADHPDTRVSEMPAFGDVLSSEKINDVAAYVLSLSSGGSYPVEGYTVFQDNCAACHGEDGRGDVSMGAPNLADSIGFYSEGDITSISQQVRAPKHGLMPAWVDRLSDDTIRQLVVYIHSLGGGQ